MCRAIGCVSITGCVPIQRTAVCRRLCADKEEEIEQEQKEAALREEALQKLIDKQLEEDTVSDEDYSIQDATHNPMNAVLNK